MNDLEPSGFELEDRWGFVALIQACFRVGDGPNYVKTIAACEKIAWRRAIQFTCWLNRE